MVSARRQQALVRGSLLSSSVRAAVINTGSTVLGWARGGRWGSPGAGVLALPLS